ncbi:EAL domain-containing protein [Oxalobacter vibrioformis]|uniref:EAL domain-containing protein n=1 Tax=Oxalobacter vibrioformis TaxID=933080 RepID=A0A9E9P2Q9_9BURK|nr:EAL domain-containing protein [Oxalobacter vibrioformis]WAW09480.1 EAL domain-containing protein [Oxalobacter vibrioformis]
MTLRRQLILLIITLFVLLFIGTFTINVHNTRGYLNDQLKTISQDTATSLGLILSPYMAESETIVMETHINALFDSGFYRNITVYGMDGKVIVERSDAEPPKQVPGWFISMFPLETPYGEALIMNGWNQAGSVHISANPEFAYIRLWAACVQSLFWFVGSFIVIFGMALVAIHYVLRPLNAVEKQAEAISNKDYVIQTRLPWTVELRRVVIAMNLMSGKIRDIFSEQEEALERIRFAAYTDNTTGLANRAYFTMRLNHMMQSGDDFEHGALVFLEISNLQAINNQSGHSAGDALLRGVSDLIKTQIEKSPANETFAARLSGSTFAIALAGISERAGWEFSKDLAAALPSLHEKGLAPTDEIGHIGLACRSTQTMQQLMSEVDMALRAAQMQGKNAFYAHKKHAADEFERLTATQWIALLRDVVERRHNTLLLQSTFDSSDTTRVMQSEVLLRIANQDGKLIPAGIFIPMVNHHGLTQAFDRMVIDEVMERLEQPGSPTEPIAINLMPASIRDPEFVMWVVTRLREKPQIAKRMLFELSEYAISQNLHAAQVWAEQILPTGAKLGIEHFGRGNTPVHLLAQLRPAYLQIDGSFIRGIDENRDNQQFVDSIVRMAHSHDIIVIAEFVETTKELDILKSLRVDGVRGYALSRPAIWTKDGIEEPDTTNTPGSGILTSKKTEEE